MTNVIDYISINNYFWIHFRSHLTSFGFSGMSRDTHFTISYHEKSTHVNFHLTKNVSDLKDKPQIKIAIIDKQLLEEAIFSFTYSVINKMLKPLDIKELKAKYNYELGFISFDSLQNHEVYSLTEQCLVNSFRDILKFKRGKTRLEIEGDIEKRLENFVTMEHIRQTYLDNIVELPNNVEKNVEGGIVLTENKAFKVIIINGKWFTISTDIKPFDVLCSFVSPEVARQLVWKIKRAIVAVKYANKYSDTKHLSKPIEIVKQAINDAIT